MIQRRGPLWHHKVEILMKDGFTREEAEWAANNKIKLGTEVVRRVRKSRQIWVRDYLIYFSNSTRERAILQAEKQLKSRNVRFGLTGDDVYNIFREISL